MLKQQIQEEVKDAMRAHDSTKVSTLRMLNSAIRYFEIDKGKDYQASDEELFSIIAKEAKKRKDSIEMYQKGNRDDLVQKEQEELKILESYLPEQMGEDEIRSTVQEVIKQTGASSPADMGKVMGPVMGKLKGKADGGMVNKIVREELSQSS